MFMTTNRAILIINLECYIIIFIVKILTIITVSRI